MTKIKDLELEVIREADILIEGNLTIRETAKRTGKAKSTIHNHMVKQLPLIDNSRYIKVRRILDKNKLERHMRGGLATQKKYLKCKVK